jgi:hypothetical protein
LDELEEPIGEKEELEEASCLARDELEEPIGCVTTGAAEELDEPIRAADELEEPRPVTRTAEELEEPISVIRRDNELYIPFSITAPFESFTGSLLKFTQNLYSRPSTFFTIMESTLASRIYFAFILGPYNTTFLTVVALVVDVFVNNADMLA